VSDDDRGDGTGSDDAPDDAAGVDPADAFGALSDPVRVGIVRALTEHARESWPPTGLGFADLRRRVGVEDPGRFRYHLERLRGRFVEQVDGDYRLTYAGQEVGAAILAGTYTERRSVGPAALDADCPLCDGAVTGDYDAGTLTVACESDHLLFLWGLVPNAAVGATVEELLALARLSLEHAVDLALVGRCSRCYAPVETRAVGDSALETETGTGTEMEADTETAAPVWLRVRCETCGGRLVGPLGFALLGDPEVEAFYRRHDRSTHDRYVWELPFAQQDAPAPVDGGYRFVVPLGDERLVVTVDEAAQVVETTVEASDTDVSDSE
jgi:hypothetical protein